MKAPWRDKTGLAKWVAIFASSLGIATGLCGLNFVGLMMVGVSSAGTNAGWRQIMNGISVVFIVAAYLELIVMVVSVVALFVLAIVREFRR